MFLMAYSLQPSDSRHQLSGNAPLSRERPAGVTPPTLPRNCRLARPVPLLFTLDLLVASGTRMAPIRTGMKGPYLGRLGLVNRNQSTQPLRTLRLPASDKFPLLLSSVKRR